METIYDLGSKMVDSCIKERFVQCPDGEIQKRRLLFTYYLSFLKSYSIFKGVRSACLYFCCYAEPYFPVVQNGQCKKKRNDL
uniref:RGS domain-containing protein n=1 Tax=Heterorhabditis bacteriophora TaxID=37862 RepID=A0A1I7W8I5_HETBA